MAQFQGVVKGRRGEATRLGDKGSGLRVEANSWQGAIRVYLTHRADTGQDMFEVRMESHHGAGDWALIAEGVVGDRDSVTIGKGFQHAE